MTGGISVCSYRSVCGGKISASAAAKAAAKTQRKYLIANGDEAASISERAVPVMTWYGNDAAYGV